MTQDRDPEIQEFFDWVKNHLLNTLPLTIIGILLWILVVAVFKTNSIEYVKNVLSTGIYVFNLWLLYVGGRTTHFLINYVLSKIIPEKKEEAA